MADQQRLLGSRGAFALAAAVLVFGLSAGRADAITLPPHPYFSLDGSSVSLSPQSAADVFQSPRAFALSHTALGLPPGANLDAVSPGGDTFDPTSPCPSLAATPPATGFATNAYFWSVDRATVGRPGGGTANPSCASFGQPERLQALSQDAAGDVYFQLFGASAAQRLNVLWWDEGPVGLQGLNRDDLDALEATDAVTGLFLPSQTTYFSVDSPTGSTLGVSGADVLRVVAGSSFRTVAWSAASLGLQAGDDVDGLCVNTEFGTPPHLLISLGRGSPSLGGQFSPADVFKVRPGADPFPGSGVQVPFLPARFLSLLPGDNVDGLDCEVLDPRSVPAAQRRPPVGPFGARCTPRVRKIPHGQTAKFRIRSTRVVPIVSVKFNGGAPRSRVQVQKTSVSYRSKKDPPTRIERRTLRVQVRFGFGPRDVIASISIKCRAVIVHSAVQPHMQPPPVPVTELVVTPDGGGRGTVTSRPPGIKCPPDCRQTFFDVFVTLTPAAAGGSRHAGWEGCDSLLAGRCRVRMNGTQGVSSRFEEERTNPPPPPTPPPPPPPPPGNFTLSVTKAGTGDGFVQGPGINCGQDCSESYTPGTNVTLVCVPTMGPSCSFSGCDSTSGNQCQVTMSANRVVNCTFAGAGPLARIFSTLALLR